MRSTERSRSLWETTTGLKLEREPLRGSLTDVDVCVVGAGIAGLTTAYLLAVAGRRVVVLDRSSIGGGESGQTTAHLSSALDDYYHVIERVHGELGARHAYASHQAAIEKVGEIAARESLDCDYERLDGYWFLSPDRDVSFLEQERDAARRAGAEDVTIVPRVPGAPFDTGPALRFPRQGQFHVLKYLAGLARAIEARGGRLFTSTNVADLEGGTRPAVSGDGFSVTAASLVICTNPPISQRLTVHSKQAPYRTFAIAARLSAAMPPMLLWDTLEEYHYVRTQPVEGDPAARWLIVGGEDVKQGHADDAAERFDRLEAWTRERFAIGEVAHRWSGMVMEPFDMMAFIGKAPTLDNVYVATGDSGHGMTHGTIAGMLISDLVAGRENPWTELYEPQRKTLSVESARDYLQENLDVAATLAAHLPGGGDVSSLEEIPPGAGAILARGLRHIAAFRGEDGAVTLRSAVCTHLGCVVRWNSQEKSWDCPCHGSRFAPTGDVLTGPARTPLAEVED